MNEKIPENIGFDDRIFLTKEEWMTYRRRKPVRYIRKEKPELCEACGKAPKPGNPLENSHKIGFRLGVINLGLTPEYVDNDENIVSAHKRICNKNVELDLISACRRLKEKGVEKLPDYLPDFVNEAWNQT